MYPVNIGDIISYNGKKGMVIGFGTSNPNTPQRRQYALVRMLDTGKNRKVHFCRIGHEWKRA